MTEKEQLEHIKNNLDAIISELTPKIKEFFVYIELLKDLSRVSEGKEPEYK